MGKVARLNRIFDPDTKTTLILPMDHGVEGYFKELEDPRSIIKSTIGAGVNAVLLRRGLARFAATEYSGHAGLILRITCASALGTHMTEQSIVSSVEEALRLGADAVVTNFFVGSNNEPEMLTHFGTISDECDRWGVPLLAEMMPIGAKGAVPFDGPYTMEDVRIAVRVGAEEGADFIKTYYPGDKESFREIVKYSPIPVVIAGGPGAKNVIDVLQMVRDAMDAGAVGIAMGRKIWGSKNPPALVRALSKIIREKASVQEAIKGLEA